MKQQQQHHLLATLFLLGSLFLYSATASDDCYCQVSTSEFANASPPADLKALTISSEDEIVNDVVLGKLLAIGSLTVLMNTSAYYVQTTSAKAVLHTCPSGFIPITKDDLQVILDRTDATTVYGATYLNLLNNNYYFTSTKVYEDKTDATDLQSFEFYAIKFITKDAKTITAQSTKSVSTRRTICKVNPTGLPTTITGYAGYDFEYGQTYKLSIAKTNAKNFFIETGANQQYTASSFEYSHTPKTAEKCMTISIRVQFFSGAIAGNCLTIWTKSNSKYGFQSETPTISATSITKVNLTSIKAKINNGLFFSAGTAPVAPIDNDNSSFLLFYSDKTDNKLYVQKLDKSGTLVNDRIPMNEEGAPFDITTSPTGFYVLGALGNTRLWVASYDFTGKQLWKRIIMNNPEEPTKADPSQLIFTQNAACDVPFGLAATYKPHNGRLNYGKGRLQVIYAHYNHFGLNANGSRNDHTGDTLINLDAVTGLNQKMHFAWGTSHSLTQEFNYDGKNLFVASLGDAFPQNINFNVCNIDTTFKCTGSSKVVAGNIPGNGAGQSSGRMSGFVDGVAENRDEKFFVYQRKEATSTFSGTVSNTENEVSLIRINPALQVLSSVKLFEDVEAKRINNIKMVRYGKNLLVAYNMIVESAIGAPYNPQSITPKTDTSFILIVSPAGIKVTGPIQVEFQISASDDWRVLENGAIVFSYVDPTTNVVSVRFFPSLNAVAAPNVIESSNKLYGQSTFVNQKTSPVRNNYNDACFQPTDPNYSELEVQPPSKNNNNNNNNNNTGGNNNNNGFSNDISATSASVLSAKALLILVGLVCMIFV